MTDRQDRHVVRQRGRLTERKTDTESQREKRERKKRKKEDFHR